MRKLLLVLLLSLLTTRALCSEPKDSLKFEDSMISFFKSDLTNTAIDSYIDDSTIIDIKGSQYFILDVKEFKKIFQVIAKPTKWIYISGTKYHKAIGYYDNGHKIIFTFEMNKDGILDTIHIY